MAYDCEIKLLPLSDGGEGSADVIDDQTPYGKVTSGVSKRASKICTGLATLKKALDYGEENLAQTVENVVRLLYYGNKQQIGSEFC